jgi:hypothetical protein
MDDAEAHRKMGDVIYWTASGVAVLCLVVGLVRAWANGSMAGSTETDLLGNLVGIAGPSLLVFGFGRLCRYLSGLAGDR